MYFPGYNPPMTNPQRLVPALLTILLVAELEAAIEELLAEPS